MTMSVSPGETARTVKGLSLSEPARRVKLRDFNLKFDTVILSLSGFDAFRYDLSLYASVSELRLRQVQDNGITFILLLSRLLSHVLEKT